jgi:hypothetical protein
MYMNWDNPRNFLDLSLYIYIYIFILIIYVASPILFMDKFLDNKIFTDWS